MNAHDDHGSSPPTLRGADVEYHSRKKTEVLIQWVLMILILKCMFSGYERECDEFLFI
jgi:hypothetical protein